MIRLLAIASFMFFPLTVAFGGGHSNNAEVNKDSSTFMMMLRVPDNKVAEAEKIFQSHEKWMRETHQGPEEPNPIVYVITKAPEFKNNDPSQGTTGFTLLGIFEAYRDASGFQAHMASAQSWKDFPKFNELVAPNVVGSILSGSVIGSMLSLIHI